MRSSIAEYYLDEIQYWDDLIAFNLENFTEPGERLQSVLLFNNIPKLAALVEHFLSQIVICRQDLVNMKTRVEQLDSVLQNNHIPLNNELITEDIRDQQRVLRESIHRLAKESLELRHDINEFLSDTILKQSHGKTDRAS